MNDGVCMSMTVCVFVCVTVRMCMTVRVYFCDSVLVRACVWGGGEVRACMCITASVCVSQRVYVPRPSSSLVLFVYVEVHTEAFTTVCVG